MTWQQWIAVVWIALYLIVGGLLTVHIVIAWRLTARVDQQTSLTQLLLDQVKAYMAVHEAKVTTAVAEVRHEVSLIPEKVSGKIQDSGKT